MDHSIFLLCIQMHMLSRTYSYSTLSLTASFAVTSPAASEMAPPAPPAEPPQSPSSPAPVEFPETLLSLAASPPTVV